MMLCSNPFTMRGRIERCWLFVHREPSESVRPLLPRGLSPIEYSGFAFWNIVVCRLRSMRPAPFPAWMGIRYWHVAYRLLVRVRLESGVDVNGLFFVRSEADHPAVVRFGNLLTDFRFHDATIDVAEESNSVTGVVETGDAHARFEIDRVTAPSISHDSPFASVEEAERFLKYPPCAIAPVDGTEMAVLLRVRRNEACWRSRVAHLRRADWPILRGRNASPEICSEVEPIDYEWRRGENVRVLS
jgi:Uncharacterized conserved protein (COG2071)